MKFELPTVSFVSAFLVLIPLPFHWANRNVCVISLIVWLAVCNLYRGINTLIWADNVTVKYKIWCDIVVYVDRSSSIGVLASGVCVCRRLSQACAPYYKAPSWHEKRRRAKFEIGVCVIVPIVYPTLEFTVRTHRFAIIEKLGCAPMTHLSIPAVLVAQAPSILLSWVALIYSGIALRWLIHRRAQFEHSLKYTRPIPPSGRYLHFFVMMVTQMGFATTMTLFILATTIRSGLDPWTSWKDVHQHWREISIHPKGSTSEIYWVLVMVAWYFVPIASVMVFSNFGFDNKVAAQYRHIFAWVKVHGFGIRTGVVVVPVLPLSASDAVTNGAQTTPENTGTKTVRVDGIASSNPPTLSASG